MIYSKLSNASFIFAPKTANIYALAYRKFTSQTREHVRKSLKSSVTEVTGQTSFQTLLNIGRGVLAVASAIGLGSLAYYGLGFSNQAGILDRSSLWPEHIKQRINTTYQYFGAGICLTAISAFGTARSPFLMNLAMKNSRSSVFVSMALLVGSGVLVRLIPYESEKFGSKQAAWALHAGLLGGMLAPLTLLGGPLLVRAALYTAGIIGGLSVVAATAPSDKFLNMGGPLAIGLGLVFASSMAGLFYPTTTKFGLSLYSFSIYGGLILFSLYLLYDTQKIVHKAENDNEFDPINESLEIYLDAINIFIRIVSILAHESNNKTK